MEKITKLVKNVIKNVWRWVWYIPYRILKFLGFGKVLCIPIGWDTLYPLAPYSEGGLLKKDFLELYKKGKVTTEEYQAKEYGKYDEEARKFEFWERKYTSQEYLKSWWV